MKRGQSVETIVKEGRCEWCDRAIPKMRANFRFCDMNCHKDYFTIRGGLNLEQKEIVDAMCATFRAINQGKITPKQSREILEKIEKKQEEEYLKISPSIVNSWTKIGK